MVVGTGGYGAHGGYGAFGGYAGGGPSGGTAGTLSGYGGDAGSSGSFATGGVGAFGGRAGSGGSGGKSTFTSDPACPAMQPVAGAPCEPVAILCGYESYNDCLCTSFDNLHCFSWVSGCWQSDPDGEGGAAGMDGAAGAATADDVSGAAQAPPPVATACLCSSSGWFCDNP